jgi:4-hydroxy-tetrahydrodipicolinate reductase
MALGIIVCGVGGRMGGAVIRAAQQSVNIKLVGAIDKPGSPRISKDAGEISGIGHIGISVSEQIASALKPNSVIIDFNLKKH